MVILYHGDVSWANGGFLGVDVFFVLSGYLITALLLQERSETGGIDLVAFWMRRARRLLPALFLVLLGVAVYAQVWAAPSELRSIRSDSIATLLYVANWKFVLDGTSYFQAFRAPSPLQHTWSLAIEEQWYLVWPIVLLAVGRVAPRRRTEVVAVGAVVLALGSALLGALLFHPGSDPSRIYYGTDTRAQALLVGAAFAALCASRNRLAELVSGRRGGAWSLTLVGALGAAALAVVMVRVDATGAFLYRGGFLLVAIAALALVAAAAVEGPVAAVLAIAPLRTIGAVSYGLYLWHWPVDVVLDAPRTHWHGTALLALRIAVTAVLATLSYHLVEMPIRRRGLGAIRVSDRRFLRPVVAAALASVLAITVVVVTIGAPATPSAPAASGETSDGVRPDPVRARVLMLGDSQMLTMLFYGGGLFADSGPQYDFAPVVGCGLFDPSVHVGGNCEEREQLWTERSRTFDPDLSVVLAGAFETLDFTVDGHRYVHATAAHERKLEAIVEASLRPLTARGGRVALLEVPCFGEPADLEASAKIRDDPAAVADVNRAFAAVASRDPHVEFVRWADAVCPGGAFRATIGGVDVRPDGVHYGSREGAKVAADALIPILRRLVDAAHAARVAG